MKFRSIYTILLQLTIPVLILIVSVSGPDASTVFGNYYQPQKTEIKKGGTLEMKGIIEPVIEIAGRNHQHNPYNFKKSFHTHSSTFATEFILSSFSHPDYFYLDFINEIPLYIFNRRIII